MSVDQSTSCYKFSNTEATSENKRKWMVFGCLHARTTTMLISLYHLAFHLAGIFVMVALLVDPRFFARDSNPAEGTAKVPMLIASLIGNSNDEIPRLDLPSAVDDNAKHRQRPIMITSTNHIPAKMDLFPTTHVEDLGNIKVWLLLTVFSFSTSLSLLIGSSYGHPTCLVPFFCLQLFDFFITSASAIAYVAFTPIVDEYMDQVTLPFPYKYAIKTVTAFQMKCLVSFNLLFGVFMKAYMLYVVWRCYQYLISQDSSFYQILCGGTETEGSGAENTEAGNPATPILPPPAYDEVIMMNRDDVAPPKYDEVVPLSQFP